MSYQIEVGPAAQKEILALPGYVRAQARQLVREIALNPRPLRAKELRDRSHIYRIWLATKWRLVYSVDDDLRIVLVLRVRRKEFVDYESV